MFDSILNGLLTKTIKTIKLYKAKTAYTNFKVSYKSIKNTGKTLETTLTMESNTASNDLPANLALNHHGLISPCL